MPRKSLSRGIGRPAFEDPADRRDRTIGVRLRADEYAALERIAKARRGRVSDVVRDAIAAYVKAEG